MPRRLRSTLAAHLKHRNETQYNSAERVSKLVASGVISVAEARRELGY